METRDAYRRPEVFAFMDSRMLGAFVCTSRSARRAARECDAWAAIARRQHERPAYFGGVPGSSGHLSFLEKLHRAPEFYGTEDGSDKHKIFMVSWLMKHSRYLYILNSNAHRPGINPDEGEINVDEIRPLQSMSILRDEPFPGLLLVGQSHQVDNDNQVDDDDSTDDDSTWVDSDRTDTDDGDSSSDGSGNDSSSSDGFDAEAAFRRVPGLN